MDFRYKAKQAKVEVNKIFGTSIQYLSFEKARTRNAFKNIKDGKNNTYFLYMLLNILKQTKQ